MKRYRCHKVVEAAPIVGVKRSEIVGQSDFIQITGSEVGNLGKPLLIEVPHDFFARGVPAPGDYLVRYNAGSDAAASVGGTYLSWSPKAVFEAGYTAE